MAGHSLIGVADSYGIELIHPRREGRTEEQMGRKSLSNQRWIVGGKLCFLLNNLGLIVDWDMDTANMHDGTAFQELVNHHASYMAIFVDTGFSKKDGQPDNLRLCRRGEWNNRMIVETVLSMLTLVCHFKKVSHQVLAPQVNSTINLLGQHRRVGGYLSRPVGGDVSEACFYIS